MAKKDVKITRPASSAGRWVKLKAEIITNHKMGIVDFRHQSVDQNVKGFHDNNPIVCWVELCSPFSFFWFFRPFVGGRRRLCVLSVQITSGAPATQ